MKEKRILEALNDIDERYIADAAPGRRSPKRPVWKRLVTAACLVLLLTGAVFWMKDQFRPSEEAETHAPQTEAKLTEAAAPAQTQAAAMTTAAGQQETRTQETAHDSVTVREETEEAVMEPEADDPTEALTEAPVESEPTAATRPTGTTRPETTYSAENSTGAPGFTVDTVSFVTYFPITPEDCSHYDLSPQESEDGLLKITEADLGPVLGTVSACADSRLIGKTVYHHAAYADSAEICVLDDDGTYLLYVAK